MNRYDVGWFAVVATTPAAQQPPDAHVPDYAYVECEPPPPLAGIVWAHRLDASPPSPQPELAAVELECARYAAEHRQAVQDAAHRILGWGLPCIVEVNLHADGHATVRYTRDFAGRNLPQPPRQPRLRRRRRVVIDDGGAVAARHPRGDRA